MPNSRAWPEADRCLMHARVSRRHNAGLRPGKESAVYFFGWKKKLRWDGLRSPGSCLGRVLFQTVPRHRASRLLDWSQAGSEAEEKNWRLHRGRRPPSGRAAARLLKAAGCPPCNPCRSSGHPHGRAATPPAGQVWSPWRFDRGAAAGAAARIDTEKCAGARPAVADGHSWPVLPAPGNGFARAAAPTTGPARLSCRGSTCSRAVRYAPRLTRLVLAGRVVDPSTTDGQPQLHHASSCPQQR